MAVESDYYGSWKIVECVSLSSPVEPTKIEGTLFNLDESGDVSWKVSEDAEPMPFFSCETYEISLGDPALLKFFGAYAGHAIEFRVEVSDDLMLLTYEQCCMLQCQKVHPIDPKDEAPFSFLGALEDGYFSDLIIISKTGKKFPVHKTILQLAVPALSWSHPPPPLSGLPDDVTATVLHYLYAECLPQGLSEDTAKQCIHAVAKLPGFSAFLQLCETFVKNTALKHQITSLVEDMHACGDKIIDMFNGKLVANGPGHSSPDEALMANPAKLCYVVKQALREAAVAGTKLLILCDLFSRRKGELSREERHEIIKYAKSRLPVFMDQLRKFLEVCKKHSRMLTPRQRQEIATYLVPELETTMDTICTFVVEAKSALEHVISLSSSTDKDDIKHKKGGGGNMGEVLGKTLKNALHMRELMKMKSFHEKTTQCFINLKRKRENYTMMTQEEKIRSVAKHLEQIMDEIPLFLVRLEELMGALSEKVTWREWKYLFKLSTSKVAWVLSKMQLHRGTLLALVHKACDMVHRDQFTQSLITLGLADTNNSSSSQQQQQHGNNTNNHDNTTTTTSSSGGGGGGNANTTSMTTTTSLNIKHSTKYAQLSAVESLCKSPYAAESKLAQQAQNLLHSRADTDMVFEIICVQECGDVVIEHTDGGVSGGNTGGGGGGDPITRTDHQKEVDIHQIPGHCVIIAARCDWFRRALLSGMRESIDKKITVHDTSPQLFALFLDYLYHGQLDTTEFMTEQLADLLALADRYEMDSLKCLCERSLRRHIDEESALFLLSLADQYNARNLRSNCLNYIMENPDVTHSEIFEELPLPLQSEVEGLTWRPLEHPPRPLHPSLTRPQGVTASSTMGGTAGGSPSSLSSGSEVDELIRALDIEERAGVGASSSSSSSEELQFMEDSARLESCVSQLRDIVGDTVPREELVRVSLAADYDINRALNYYYTS